jgi:serine/threonine protein kinase
MLEPPMGMQVGRFGPFEVNLTTGELRKHGIRLKLQDQPFQILAMLLARPGKLVTREEIRHRLWPSGTFVDFDNGLNTALCRLREALGDSAESPRYIETLARRGYRWIVPVDWMASRSADLPAAVSVEAPSEAEATSDNLIGKKISHYRVLEVVGGGGMGVVYKAEDLKLGRSVALKFLPQELVRNSSALERFEREARAASALNHPHICTIYEFADYEGQPFIVMELLEGQTLRERLGNARERLRKDELIDLAIQITDGLDAAHQKGIIHRDIKTANIFLTNRGEAKILDFGLARIVDLDEYPHNGLGEKADETLPPREYTSMLSLNSTLTHTGAMIGTVSYMSPEQVRGEKLDSRTDLFSFGLVLYEMATGQRAFRGNTVMEVNEAILHRTPAPAREWNAELPPGLELIIDKALQKDRGMRYHSASEMRADLRRLRRDTDSGRILSSGGRAVNQLAAEPATRSVAVAQPSAGLARKREIVLAACVALLAAAFVAYHFWPRSNTSSGPAKITRISQWNKPMHNATLSPDGHAVAFTSPVGGVAQAFLMLTSGGEPLQLTNDEGSKYVDNFSPDGKEIYYEKFGSDEVWAVPTLGGAPRHVVSASSVVPSPDGAFIYYVKSDFAGIFRSGKSGLNEELVYKSEGTGLLFAPALLFPGGNDLLAAGVTGYEPKFRLYRINVTSHEAIDLGEVDGNYDVVWAEPGNTVLFSRTVNGLTNIWKYSLNDRSLKQITFGTGPDYCPMPDPGGKGIYFVNGQSSGSMTVYHVQSKESKDIVSEEAVEPNISPDGKRVMYITLPAPERYELWVSDIDGGNKVKLATGEDLDEGTWAPDNFHLSFFETGAGAGAKSAKTYIVGADGSGLRQLPRIENIFLLSAWSPDQKTIYVTGVEKASPTPHVWKLSVDGSKPEKFMDNCGLGGVTDADTSGQFLLWVTMRGEKTGIYEIAISDRKCISLLPGVATFSATFARDGKSFLYAVASRGEVTIFRQPWRDGKIIGAPQVALKLPFAFPLDYKGKAYDFSRDLSTIVYARPGGHADLYHLSQK